MPNGQRITDITKIETAASHARNGTAIETSTYCSYMRNGPEEMRSIFGTYMLVADPIITHIGNFPEDANVTFGAVGSAPIIDDRRRAVAASLLKETTVGERDYMKIVSTSKLGIDLLANQTVVSKRYKGKKIKDPIPNPNKMLYNQKVSSLCYEDGMNTRRKQPARGGRGDGDGSSDRIPPRYKRQVRPGFKASGTFDPSARVLLQVSKTFYLAVASGRTRG